MPADGLDQLRRFDAIYFGAVGAPDVPDHITLWTGRRQPGRHFLDRSPDTRALGEHEAAARLMQAVERVTAAGVLTPDLGGKATTREVTGAVCDALLGANA